MARPTAAVVLRDLLAARMDGQDEAEFSVYLDPPEGLAEERLVRREFDAAVADVTASLGEPDLRASLDDGPELPDWAWASDLAVVAWRLGDRIAAVRLEHAAPDLPLAVVVSVMRDR